ncbi:DUF411 domain-containing protein [Hoeflea sp. AS60]|uniref:DUF411 domain-containing protein n=1 Tax=Hoeflea sp. AS60 TaxID=3135780 RepID=UPI003173F8B4
MRVFTTRRYLAPDIIGLAFPGMPTGSPGMEYGTSWDAIGISLIIRLSRRGFWNQM